MNNESQKLTHVESAIARARAGRTTIIDIVGHGGYGKTRLLRSIARGFPSEQVLRATAFVDSQRAPMSLLEQIGVDIGPPPTHVMRASHMLGGQLGLINTTEPAILLLDDLQWADAESIDAIGMLLERSAGDRILVAAAHRPTGPSCFRWQKWLNEMESVVTISLDGLDDEETTHLIADAAPDADLSASLVHRLREHTRGNPLYLRSLLREYDVEDLAARANRGDLPGTDEIAHTLNERLRRADDSVIATLGAIAVLGDRGAEPLIVADVAGCDIRSAIGLLRDDGLVVADGRGPDARVRIFHGIVRAAVYDFIPPESRAEMHMRAAICLPSVGDRLLHRNAAAGRADEGLARDLEEHADDLHRSDRFREAALYRRHAAHLSATSGDRRRRFLDSDFEAILGLDLDDLWSDSEPNSDDAHSRVVRAAKLVVQFDFVAAADLLDELTDDAITALPSLTAYRARVLRARAVVESGRAPQSALDDLDAAEGGMVTDDALAGYVMLSRMQGRARSESLNHGQMLIDARAYDRAQMVANPQGFLQLAWRGASHALSGFPEDAIRDLTPVTRRFSEGLNDLSDGAFHTAQGLAHFLNGQWGRALSMFEVAHLDHSGALAPFSSATMSVPGIIAADAARAHEGRQSARQILIAAPGPSAVQLADITDVLGLYLLGTESQRSVWLREREEDLGSPTQWTAENVPYLWYVAHGIAAHWAGRPRDIPTWSGLLASTRGVPWGAAAADWMSARADPSEAATQRLTALAREGLPGIPLLDAMLKVDAAQRPSRSQDQLHAEAARAVRSVGAGAFLSKLLPEASIASAADITPLGRVA